MAPRPEGQACDDKPDNIAWRRAHGRAHTQLSTTLFFHHFANSAGVKIASLITS
jgi:hypothetical protein